MTSSTEKGRYCHKFPCLHDPQELADCALGFSRDPTWTSWNREDIDSWWVEARWILAKSNTNRPPESVAEYTRKPLFRVNVGELTMEQNVVPRLQAIFRKASRWDAILLLDEADVVLEERSYEDLKRNGIVSVFLRMLGKLLKSR